MGRAGWKTAGMRLLLWTNFRFVKTISPTVNAKHRWNHLVRARTLFTYHFWTSRLIFGLQTNRMKMRTPWVMLIASVRWKNMLSGLIAHEMTSMLHVTPIMMNNRRKRLKLNIDKFIKNRWIHTWIMSTHLSLWLSNFVCFPLLSLRATIFDTLLWTRWMRRAVNMKNVEFITIIIAMGK